MEFAERESRLNSSSKAQGTIECLVIIAIVVVISLVVVGLMMQQMDSSVNVSKTSNKIGDLTQSIGITESLVSPTDQNFVVKLLNNSGSTITISNVQIGDSNVNFSEDLTQAGSKLFKVPNASVCELGKVVSQDVVVTYVTVEGLTKTERYPAEVMFDCSPFVIAQANLANQCPSCGSIPTFDGNASSAQVLRGYSFFSDSSTKQNGSLTIASYLHSKQTRCWNMADAEVACGSADGNTIYQDARTDGNVANFTDLGNGTVRDNFTGLIWQKDYTATMTWYKALGYCAQLDLGGYAVGSWRLPSVVELTTLIDYNCYGGAYPDSECSGVYLSSAFPAPSGWGDCDSGYCGFWSSTTVPHSPVSAYNFYSMAGGIQNDAKYYDFIEGTKCVHSP